MLSPYRLAGLAFVLVAGTALAQAPAQRPTPRPAAPPAAGQSAPAPERTLAVYGEWMVRCGPRPSGEGRACEMAQTVQGPRQQPVAQYVFGRTAPDAPWQLLIQLPLNVSVATPVRLTLDPPLTLAFRTCAPSGCFAGLDLDEATLRRLTGAPATTVAAIEYRDANQGEVKLPFALRGFTDAFAVLGRENN